MGWWLIDGRVSPNVNPQTFFGPIELSGLCAGNDWASKSTGGRMTTAAEYQEKTVGQLIVEWTEIAKGNVTGNASVFLRFMAMWITFETLYNTGAEDNPNAVMKWKKFLNENPCFEIEHKKLLETENPEYAEACEILIWGICSERFSRSEHGTIIKDQGYPTYLNRSEMYRLDNIMLSIYDLRKNFFHACTKTPKDKNDYQKVNAAYTVLCNVLKDVGGTNSNEITQSWLGLADSNLETRPSLLLKFGAAWIAFSARYTSYAVSKVGITRCDDSWKDEAGHEYSEKDLREIYVRRNNLSWEHQQKCERDQEYGEGAEMLVRKRKAGNLIDVIEEVWGVRNAVFHGKYVGGIKEQLIASLRVLMFLLRGVS